MGPLGHTVISGALGVGVGAVTGSPEAGATALGVGVLMDVDHLFDFYQWYVKGKGNRIFLLFHAWEYSVIGVITLAVAFFHPIFLALVLAHLAHVATDHFHNHLPPWAYFISYRIAKKFDTAYIVPGTNVMYFYKSWHKMLPFNSRLCPWFRRRIEPWFDLRVERILSIDADTGKPN